MKNKTENKPLIYQTKDGAIELRSNIKTENIWASKTQIAQIFGVDRSVVLNLTKANFQAKAPKNQFPSAPKN